MCHNGSFQGAFAVRFLDGDKRRAVLLNDLSYIDMAGRKHTAHAGLVFDGLSIPRLLWLMPALGSPWTGPYRKASPIHDAECTEARACQITNLRRAARYAADQNLREMVGVLGGGRTIQSIVYRGVRVGAWWDEVRR